MQGSCRQRHGLARHTKGRHETRWQRHLTLRRRNRAVQFRQASQGCVAIAGLDGCVKLGAAFQGRQQVIAILSIADRVQHSMQTAEEIARFPLPLWQSPEQPSQKYPVEGRQQRPLAAILTQPGAPGTLRALATR